MQTFDNCFYCNKAKYFYDDNYDNELKVSNDFINMLEDRHHKIYSNGVGDWEKIVWRDSINQMHNRMCFRIDSERVIPDSTWVIIEYVFKNYPKQKEKEWQRADFIICGKSNNQYNLIIIELKSWPNDYIEKGESSNEVKRVKGGIYPKHPVDQVLEYKQLITKHNKFVKDNSVNVYSCVYAHNVYEEKQNEWLHDNDGCVVYLCRQGNQLRKWIYSLTKDTNESDGKFIAEGFLNSDII